MTYQINPTSKKHAGVIFDVLTGLGYRPAYSNTKDRWIQEGYNFLLNADKSLSGNGPRRYCDLDRDKLVTLSEFLDILSKEEEFPFFMFDHHKLTVTKEGIKLDCGTLISNQILDEIIDAINEVRNRTI